MCVYKDECIYVLCFLTKVQPRKENYQVLCISAGPGTRSSTRTTVRAQHTLERTNRPSGRFYHAGPRFLRSRRWAFGKGFSIKSHSHQAQKVAIQNY
jgi:hypothetical protein